ncbi:MAG TPA: hypothetical protein VKH42_07345, partial [Vicinamibacterales bacterium]|nr:hypothetical protein [Vicinamibacterales bacterium]
MSSDPELQDPFAVERHSGALKVELYVEFANVSVAALLKMEPVEFEATARYSAPSKLADEMFVSAN